MLTTKQKETCKRYYDKHPEQRKASAKMWRVNNKERISAYNKAYRQKNIEKLRIYDRTHYAMAVHSMSLSAYDTKYNELLIKQQGVCAICKRPQKAGTRPKLYMDHNHTTGQLRGLLCSNCNTALGLFSDNENTLNLAREYLLGYEKPNNKCFVQSR